MWIFFYTFAASNFIYFHEVITNYIYFAYWRRINIVCLGSGKLPENRIMSEKKRLLIVTQDMEPFTEGGIISKIANQLPLYAQEQGLEIRVLMPRYGVINERRHRLHEVVRLSGMNIIVQNEDYPLIIKVASLPNARLQVYFLDNEDFFKRKSLFHEEDGTPFEDNADRMVFFCKGVLETVKKFGWAPDIVHCHGWMTSLIPAYIKTSYKNDPIFQNSKVVYSMYQNDTMTVTDGFIEIASINNMDSKELDAFQNGPEINLHSGAIKFADAVIAVNLSREEETTKPTINHDMDDEGLMPTYLDFYDKILN